jgi:hypothetical protein
LNAAAEIKAATAFEMTLYCMGQTFESGHCIGVVTFCSW